ncbi:MAG: hypothetical protein ACLTDR_06440 [Adlercreutzia equolifaciens]
MAKQLSDHPTLEELNGFFGHDRFAEHAGCRIVEGSRDHAVCELDIHGSPPQCARQASWAAPSSLWPTSPWPLPAIPAEPERIGVEHHRISQCLEGIPASSPPATRTSPAGVSASTPPTSPTTRAAA